MHVFQGIHHDAQTSQPEVSLDFFSEAQVPGNLINNPQQLQVTSDGLILLVINATVIWMIQPEC